MAKSYHNESRIITSQPDSRATGPERAGIPPDRAALCSLGWNENWEGRLPPDLKSELKSDLNSDRRRVVRIISARRDRFLVSDGREEWLCAPAGKLRHSRERDYPVTGDWVIVEDSVILGILPRKNILSRGESGSRGDRADFARREQPMGANLDTVFIVCGLDRDFNLRRIERYLTLVYNCGMNPVVALTKADLHPDPDHARQEVEAVAFGVPVVATSIQDRRGIPELETFLTSGRTVAMIGSSGAGKSTLANLLYEKEIQSTAAVSATVGKGRHTTTTRDLIPMPRGGLLMDNPGIREIAFHEGGEGLETAFSDIHALAQTCRFSDCRHQNEPGCAVRQAVETGELPGERLENFHKMGREMDYLATRQVKSADRVEKERWKDISKMQKRMKKGKKG